MQTEKKYFPAGSGNFDDADFALGENDWVNMENCRVGSTDKGVVGTVESVGSNILLSPAQPSVTLVTIGTIDDTENNRIIYFQKNLHGPWDKIIAFNIITDTFYTVLDSAQVTGGLTFDKNKLIHSVRIVNGLLFWTDNLNEPRRININAGINLNHPGTFPNVDPYTSPLAYENITVIRRPPYYPLQVSQQEDISYENNFTGDEAFQFNYRYVYRDGEQSALGPWSVLVPYNNPDETFNSIAIAIPLQEPIDQDVRLIDLVVRFGNGGTGFVVKTWDTENPDDAAEIADHNDGIDDLDFDFYNDIVGTPLDAAYMNKPFDSVPLLSQTLETANNRLFLGNNVEGYDTPVTTSLTAEFVEVEDGGSNFGIWTSWYFEVYDPFIKEVVDTIYFYVITVPGGTYTKFFFDTLPYPSTLPASIDITTATFSANGVVQVADFIFDNSVYGGGGYQMKFPQFVASEGTSLIIGGGVGTGTRVFKSNSTYGIGIVFFDRFRRKCGVKFGANVTTPYRSFTQTVYNAGITWTLSDANAVNEIPDWAYYYAIVRTLNLTTRFFLQARSAEHRYVTKDASGNYVFTQTAYSEDAFGIGIKISALASYGMGYIFADGDLIILYLSTTSNIYTLRILDQAGDYLVCQLEDVGTLDGTVGILFEIYTPYVAQINEFYYELGEIYPVLDPTTPARRYSLLSDTLNGDIYLLTRTEVSSLTFLAETMSPNDKYWQNWYSDIGWPNIFDRIGQQTKVNSVSYSDVLIPGTRINGLSTFEALNEKSLPAEAGPLIKLQVTSKVSTELGIVMLGICEDETLSMYLGEVQLLGSDANAPLAQLASVIGTINALKGSFGTRNPESVIEFRGNVYWVDVPNGKVIQYSLNGLFPISQYKMTRYWKLFCEQYMSMTETDIEALGSRPFIFTAVDKHHNELLITVPRVLETPPAGYLIDYPSSEYPFDIWDGQEKTLVYKLAIEPNFWQGAYRFGAEYFITIANELFSFKHGLLYRHNDTDSYSNFYGIQYKPRIMYVSNQLPDQPKAFNTVSVRANMCPTLTYFYNDYPYVQTSDLLDFDYSLREGVYYAPIYRNKIIPTATGMTTAGLLTAEKMRSQALKVLLEFTSTTTPLELRFTSIGFNQSVGHTI